MILTQIKATHFKGQTFTQPLRAISVIRGPNARGKSSRVEAAVLALAKCLPGILKNADGKPMKSNRDIFDAMASGNPMSSEVTFDNGNVTGVRFTEKNGTVSVEETGNGRMPLPMVLWSADEFLNLSGPARTAFIFSRAKVDLSIEKLTATICANIKNIKLEENTPETETSIKEIVEAVLQLSTSAEAEAVTPQHYIETLNADIKEKLRIANENSRRMAATVAGLTQIKANAPVSSDIEARLATARAELDAANAEVARLKQVGIQIKSELDGAELKASSWHGHPVPDPVAPLLAEKGELEAYLLREDQIQAEPVTSKHEGEVLQTNRTRLADAMTQLGIASKAYMDFNELECCPTCKAKAKGWKSAVMDSLIEAESKAREVHDFYKNSVAESQLKFDAAEELVKKEALRQNTIRTSNKRLAEVNASLRRYSDESAKQLPAQEASAKLPGLREKIHAAREEYNTAVIKASLKSSIWNNLDTERNKLVQERAESASRAKSIEQAAKFKAEASVLKEVVKLLDALQKEVVKASVSPIIDKVNEFCGEILDNKIAFQDGEIGMMGATGFWKHGTMSDSQRLLAYAALSIALATEAPFRLCILGRFESFDYATKFKVLRRVRELIRDGKLHQCLCIEVDGGEVPVNYDALAGDDFLVVNLM